MLFLPKSARPNTLRHRTSSSRQQSPTSTDEAKEALGETNTTVAKAAIIATANAQTQARIPADPEAAARAAVAVSALAQGIRPPILPRELARLDRVEWVLRRTSLAEVSARLKKQVEEEKARPKEGTRGRGRDSDDGSDGLNDSDDDGLLDGGGDRAAERGGGGDRGGGGGRGAGDIETSVGLGEQQVQYQDERTGLSQDRTGENTVDGLLPIATHAILATSPQTADNEVTTTAGTATTSIPATGPTRTFAGRQEEVSFYSGGGGGGRDECEDDDEDEGYGVVDRLAALFEFLRTGNSFVLPPDLQDEWEARPDLGLGLLSADDHIYDPRSTQVASPPVSSIPAAAAAAAGGGVEAGASPGGAKLPAGSKNGVKNAANDGSGSGSGGGGGGGGGGVSSWRRLCRESDAGGGEPMTFHDLQMALTATTQRWRITETTDDRLEKRLVERRERAERMTAALWGNERERLAENPYTRPIDLQPGYKRSPSPPI